MGLCAVAVELELEQVWLALRACHEIASVFLHSALKVGSERSWRCGAANRDLPSRTRPGQAGLTWAAGLGRCMRWWMLQRVCSDGIEFCACRFCAPP